MWRAPEWLERPAKVRTPRFYVGLANGKYRRYADGHLVDMGGLATFLGSPAAG